MRAAVGDRFHVRGNIVGQPERTGEIIEVRGAGGERSTWCVSTTGTPAWCSPGPDATNEHPRRKGKKSRRKADSFSGVTAQSTQNNTRFYRDRCAGLTGDTGSAAERRSPLAGTAATSYVRLYSWTAHMFPSGSSKKQ